jgi:hypothetical protein
MTEIQVMLGLQRSHMQRSQMEHVLRTILLLPALLCIHSGLAASEAPFAPQANQPDYAVTMTESSYGKYLGIRTVIHHESWTRVDRIQESYFSTEYFSAKGTTVRTYNQGSTVSFLRGGEPNYPGVDREAHETAERQRHLGENCTVWDVWRTKNERNGINTSCLSCVTDDGIEMWQRSGSVNETFLAAEATRVERRLVTPEEVTPPRILLKLDWWNQNVPVPIAPETPNHETDHETIMARSDDFPDPEKSIRTTRRLGPWQSREEIEGGVRRRFEITHDSRAFRFDYAGDESGAPKQLTIMRPRSAPSDTAAQQSLTSTFGQPKNMNRSETILGEICRWFDVAPGMEHGGASVCLTGDGIVLKEQRYSRGGARTWTAIRVTRRPINLDEIKPPAELLEPTLWGIE